MARLVITVVAFAAVVCAFAAAVGAFASPSSAQEYVPELSVTFSTPNPVPGDQVTISGTTEFSAAVVVSIDGSSLATDVAEGDGSFSLTVTIPDLAAGAHVLSVDSAGTVLGTLPIVVAEVADEPEATTTDVPEPDPTPVTGPNQPDELALTDDSPDDPSVPWTRVGLVAGGVGGAILIGRRLLVLG